MKQWCLLLHSSINMMMPYFASHMLIETCFFGKIKWKRYEFSNIARKVLSINLLLYNSYKGKSCRAVEISN